MIEFLSAEEVSELQSDHKVEEYCRYADRIKSVLMRNKGYSWSEISEILLLDETTVRSYVSRYLEDGLEGLCSDNYSGRASKLSFEEEDKLCSELRSKIYPTTSSIVSFVLKEFKVKYSVGGMNKLLHRLGFSYKKPDVVPGKANAEVQLEFVSMLEELKESKDRVDPILYVDGVHPQHNSHPDYGWLPVGEKTELKTNTGRQRVTLSGALDSETLDILIREDKRLNAENTIKFLKKIEASYPLSSTIYIVLDNAGYFKGQKIKEFLLSSKIQFLYLPPYAPNLNLIERVWKFFKKKALANRYYQTFPEFRAACLQFFHKRNWKYHKEELESLLSSNFQITGS